KGFLYLFVSVNLFDMATRFGVVSGIWIVDFEVAQLYIGKDMPVNREDALRFFNSDEKRIIEFDKGSRWFIPSFIEFQYGALNELNRAHNSVLTLLRKYNLNPKKKVLTSPLQGAMDKDKDKDKDKEMVKGLEIDSKYSDILLTWLRYKRERKESYKAQRSVFALYKNLVKYSGNRPEIAIEIIEKSMASNYAGIIEPKINPKPEQSPKTVQVNY
ncbi:MAG: hypothetical protein M1445_14400, partial [Bacteroidetes bacterium]|nr:hypothetical protein [Bacteroidota bacterium]